MKTYQMYIDGAWTDAANKETFESKNPYTGEPWAMIPRGQQEDADRAVAAAARAFRSDARSSDSEHIHVSVDGRTLTIIDNVIAPDAVNRFDFFKDILLYRTRDALADRLLQLGVDVSVTTLGRFEDKIAFVVV